MVRCTELIIYVLSCWMPPNSEFKTWMALKSSVLIYQELSHLQPQWPLWPQQPQCSGLNDHNSLISSKELLNMMVNWIILSAQITNTSPFLRNGSSKSNFSLIFDTLSFRGCWGQPMLLFWKLVDETQISKPLELTRHHKSIKLWIQTSTPES